jgi:hypothetical protein
MQLKTKPIFPINELLFYLLEVKGKGKTFAEHAMKTFSWRRGIAPLMFKLRTR